MSLDLVTLALAKKYTDEKVENGGSSNENGNNSLGITGAAVGQIAQIAEVDVEGNPVKWIPINIPDSLSIGTELGVINPVTNENGAFFTDENNKILSL